MRVMLLSQQPGVGGAERLALGAFHLMKSIDVTVVAPHEQCELAATFGLPSMELPLPRVRTRFIGPLRLVWRSLQVRRLAKSLHADVIYANASRAMGFGLGAKLLGGPPLLVHNHHLLRAKDITMLEAGLLDRRRLIAALERFADLIVVPSETAGAAFVRKEKIRIIPNGVDLERFSPAPSKAAAKAALGLPRDALVVGTATRADPRKGIKTFLEIAEILGKRVPPPAILVVGGASFPHEVEVYEEVRKAAESSPADIVFTGIVDNTAPAFQAMDLMVHSSEVPESFGLTVAEAMACAVPVVGFDWGGISEIVENGVTGVLVEPMNIEEMAGAIEILLHDNDRRRGMGLAARRRCEEFFDIKVCAAKIESLIHEVAERPPR